MRHRRTRDIVIELTSLLDVVMILIFAVMINNSKLVEKSQTDLQIANAQLEELQGLSDELQNALGKLDEGDREELLVQLQNSENRLDSYEYMDNIMIVVNIGLENRYNNSSRCLTFGKGTSSEEYQYFEIPKESDRDWITALNKLKLYIKDCTDYELERIEEEKYVYFIFSVDTSKVYSDDFDDIESAIEKEVSRHSDGKVRYIYAPKNKKGED